MGGASEGLLRCGEGITESAQMGEGSITGPALMGLKAGLGPRSMGFVSSQG